VPKDLIRSKDFETASRQVPQVELGEVETAAIRALIGNRMRLFPLLSRLVEEDYGPEGDVCILPSQLLALKEEVDRFSNLVAEKASDEAVYTFGKANLTARDLGLLVARIGQLADDAMRSGESLFAFAD